MMILLIYRVCFFYSFLILPTSIQIYIQYIKKFIQLSFASDGAVKWHFVTK